MQVERSGWASHRRQCAYKLSHSLDKLRKHPSVKCPKYIGIIRFNIKNDSSTCSTPRCRAYLRIWPQGPGFICDQGDAVVCKYVAILLGFSNFHFFFMACSLVTGYLYIVRFPDPLAIGPGKWLASTKLLMFQFNTDEMSTFHLGSKPFALQEWREENTE